jgi:hypothetical protein
VTTRDSRALIVTVALIAYYVALLVVGERDGSGNRRHTTLLVLGAQASARSGDVANDAGNLIVNAGAAPAAASWGSYSYEIGHLLRRARSCAPSAALVGTGLTSPDARGSADILINGEVVKHITFSSARRGLYPFAGARLVPANVVPEIIELVPLDPEYGFLIPIPQRYCSADGITVGIRLTDAVWTISHAGAVLDYTPAPFSAGEGAALAAAGALLMVMTIFGIYVTLRQMSRLGTEAIVATALVLLLAPLAYDEWDFRLWTGFGEVAVFGHGDPAYLWYGSPLWAFIPALFSTMTAATFVITGHGGQSSTADFMKIAMGVAYCYSAYAIALRAPARLRTFFSVLALLLPIGLYELAGGYRQLFASAIAIGALVAATRWRLALATVLGVMAASISEELLPLCVMPAVLALTSGGGMRKRVWTAVALLATTAILFLAEWKLLIPRAFAADAFAYRFGPAPLGGASWAGALNGLGLLPPWLPARSPTFGALLFLALSAFPATRLIRTIRFAPSLRPNETFDEVAGVFVAFVAAFLVAFRGTDPNLWYSLSTIALWYFASANPLNPFPLILGSICGLAFYANVGLREFVNQAYFWPIGTGLLGFLSTTHWVYALMADALMLALIFAISTGNPQVLFSRASPIALLLFITVVMKSATATLPLDSIIVGATAALVWRSLARYCRGARSPRLSAGSPLISGAGIAGFAGAGAYFGARGGLVGLCASAACVLAARAKLGASDIALGVGAIVVIAVQPGAGVVSLLGSAALICVLVGIVWRALEGLRTER